eukprot:3400-Heterococcus_DN1.PRE.5
MLLMYYYHCCTLLQSLVVTAKLAHANTHCDTYYCTTTGHLLARFDLVLPLDPNPEYTRGVDATGAWPPPTAQGVPVSINKQFAVLRIRVTDIDVDPALFTCYCRTHCSQNVRVSDHSMRYTVYLHTVQYNAVLSALWQFTCADDA